MSKYGVFSGPYFPVFGTSVFSPNTGKYGPEKTLYLHTLHATVFTKIVIGGKPLGIFVSRRIFVIAVRKRI